MLWITATNLNSWSETRLSQQELSLVGRRLIIPSCKTIKSLRFPAGDSVALPGWDGILDCDGSTFPVPSGKSVWEFGTSKKVLEKAESDFNKRSKAIKGINPKETTLVIVTSRRWPSKKASRERWLQTKRRRGPWRDVQIIDADDLEAWLEQTPSVAAWLSSLHGKPTEGAEALDAYWNRFATDMRPVLSPEMILAGRERLAEHLSDWAAGDSPILRIKADTIHEAILLVAAAAKSEGGAADLFLFANALVVHDIDTWRKLANHERPLVLFPAFASDALGMMEVVGRGHWIVVPSDWAAPETEGMLIAPWLDREKLQLALHCLLVDEMEARRHADSCGRSFQVLMRRLALAPERRVPAWATATDGRILAPALLAGRWNSSREGDREVLSELSGQSYNDWEANLLRYLSMSDAPIRQIGKVFVVTSPIDAWLLLCQYVPQSLWTRYAELLTKLLLERDPKLDIEAGKRWYANLYGKERRQSNLLRQGLLEQLARLIGAEDEVRLNTSPSAADVARQLTNAALVPATDTERWASVGPLLSILGEAAPAAFLNRLEEAAKSKSFSESIFENVDAFFGTSAHVHIMFALQRIRWFPDFLFQLGSCLVALHASDPGGNSSPRPQSVFVETFCPQLPNNLLRYDDQLSMLAKYLERDGAASWGLVYALIDSQGSFQVVDHGPSFRKTDGRSDKPGTWGELRRRIFALLELLIKFSNNDSDRWFKLVGLIDDVHPEARDLLLQNLRLFVLHQKSIENESLAVYHRLMDLVRRHEAFSDCNWALPSKWLRRIRSIASFINPESNAEIHRWLFKESMPDRYLREDCREDDLLKARCAAVRKIYRAEGIDGVNTLKSLTSYPGIVGAAIANSAISKADQVAILEHFIAKSDEGSESLVRGLVAARFHREGAALEDFVNQYGSRLNDFEFGRFAQGLPYQPQVWDFVDQRGDITRRVYWSGIGWFVGSDPNDVVRAARNLIEFEQYYVAINTVGLAKATLPVDIVLEAIQTVPKILEKVIDPLSVNNFRFDVVRLFKMLRKSSVDRSVLVRLEFEYYPLLENAGYDFPFIVGELSKNPSLFIDLLKMHYKREDGTVDDGGNWKDSENAQGIAHRLFDILHDFSAIPGLDGQGKDAVTLMTAWIQQAIKLAASVSRRGVAESKIGDALARAPMVPDQVWPPIHVCDAIELFWSDDLGSGFNCGAHNKLGARWVGEGQADASLAEQYRGWASARQVSHPRTSALLRELAEGFRKQSEMHKQDAELNRQIE